MKIPLSLATKLEKRIGVRVWDGLLYNQDAITDPHLTVLPNKVGTEIRAILALGEYNHLRPSLRAENAPMGQPGAKETI